MTKSSEKQRSKRVAQFGLLGLVGLLMVGFLAYWFLFRDTAPASVASVEAAQAREAAIAASTQDLATATPGSLATATPGSLATATAGSIDDRAEVEPDLVTPTPVGEPTDGRWSVDTSIGSFDDSCLSDVCSSSFVGFRINEELASIGAKTVVGRTGEVSGTMELAGSQVTAASIVVDMTTLVTDDDRRTTAITGTSGGLETKSFPEASFVLTEPIELTEIPDEGVTLGVQAVGDLTVHGVTRQVTIPLTVELRPGLVIAFGNLENMLLADYDIPGPSAFGVVSVEDNATMELQLFFSQ